MHVSKLFLALIALLTLAATLASPDHLVVFTVGAVLWLGVWLLWPQTDAPMLLLVFSLHWLAVAVKPIETAIGGQNLDDLSDFGAALTPAAYLALAGVGALGLGLRVGAGGRRFDWSETLSRDSSRWSAAEIIPVAIGLIVLGNAFDLTSGYAGGARQIFQAFAGLRNAGLFILAYWCLREGKALAVLAAVVALEIVFGMTGFFAGFRESFLVLAVAAVAARPRLSFGGFAAATVLFALMLTISVFWSAIKPDYREFLNQGSQQQVVTQPLGVRLSYLGKAADEFNGDQFRKGLQLLVARVSYIDFLANTLQYVPNHVPHENGKRLGDAIINIIQPRLIFPDKPPTPNDSEVTAYYTGLHLNLSGGTSISIGYLGELYIDFGYVGAVIGAFLIGVFAGGTYRILRGYRGIPLFISYGIATMAMVDFSIFETDLVRYLGSTLTAFAASLILQRVVAPQVLLALAPRTSRLVG